MAALRLRDWPLVVTCVFAMHTRELRAQARVDATNPGVRRDSMVEATLIRSKPTGCMANIPAEAMHRVPVYVSGLMMNDSDSAFSRQADLMAQDVAEELRTQLGGSDRTIVVEDGNLAWYSIPTSIVVVARRSGEVGVRPYRVGGDSSATLVLRRAFDSAHARGAAMLAWPDQVTTDSVFVRLDLWPSFLDVRAKQLPFASGLFPVFTLTVPRETPPVPLAHQPPPRYPAGNELGRYTGTLLMEAMVDSAGRTNPASIHDVWPEGVPRLVGRDGDAYDAFVSSVTEWLKTLRFRPALLGSCPRSHMVQIPLEFKMPGMR